MRNLQCQRIFQAGNIVNSVKLHPNQQEVLVGDAVGETNFEYLLTEFSSTKIEPESVYVVQW